MDPVVLATIPIPFFHTHFMLISYVFPKKNLAYLGDWYLSASTILCV